MKTLNYYERFWSRQWEIVKLFYGICFYNHFMSFDYVLDICLAPLYRFVDNYVSVLGPAFVICCGSVMCAVIIISYWIGLPYWWNKNPLFTIFLLVVGNWLMVNAIFHFYMGIMCDPGRPGQMKEIKGAVSVCKKCIIPKPHRTHHCSVCNDCILLMDHHCPWLNNCVGHYNRRYFFLYMVYIVAGVLFLMIFGVEILFKEIWLQDVVSPEIKLSGHSLLMHSTEQINSTLNSKLSEKTLRKRCIIFTALMCIGTFIALGLLMIRHIRLISRGETTIEMYINRSLTERCKKKHQAYINPYDFGKYKNWTLLFGIYNRSGRTWKHILFPSTHKPFGNGFEWPSINSNETEWNHFLNQ